MNADWAGERPDYDPEAAVIAAVPDAEIPWWAISLLDLERGSPEWKVRKSLSLGKRPRPTARTLSWFQTMERLRHMAEAKVMTKSIDQWRDAAYNDIDSDGNVGPLGQVIRDAALGDMRAFCTFIDLKDDDGQPIVLKDFQIHAFTAMRTEDPAIILLPWEHSKSWGTSILLPLIDWCEWADCTQGRVYWSDSHVNKWLRRLMGEVEHNEAMHKLFPWVRKPLKSDKTYGVWSTEGFAIGGRSIPDRSFEPLTAKSYSTGNRYHRVVGDDWVTRGNSDSRPVQEKLFEYLMTGPMTMRQTTSFQSKYGTKFPTFTFVGTLFSSFDVNTTTFKKFKRKGYYARRWDVFPFGQASIDRREVLWPEKKSFDYVMEKREELGVKLFNMRMRNIVASQTHAIFRPDEVEMAFLHEYRWREVPDNTRLVIGFDPGKGVTTRWAKNPAFVVYGERDLPDDGGKIVHLIEWSRMEGMSFTRQCDKLVELAQHYNCRVVVEDNGVQSGYSDYIRRFHDDVKVECHTTGKNKRDPRDGVETFVPLFESHRILIHAKDAPSREVKALKEEFETWSSQNPGDCDIVMAAWFARHNMQVTHKYDEGGLDSYYAQPEVAQTYFGGGVYI